MKEERDHAHRVTSHLVGRHYRKGKMGCGSATYIGRCNCVDDGTLYENTQEDTIPHYTGVKKM